MNHAPDVNPLEPVDAPAANAQTARKWWLPPTLLTFGLFFGLSLGALTNSINTLISPYYFRRVMYWNDLDNERVFLLAIRQGIFEGAILGVAYAIFFSIAAGMITGLRCPLRLVVQCLVVAILIVLGSWLVGGLVGLGWALLSPGTFQASVRTAPSEYAVLLPFAWVGGTIYGAYAGTIISATYAAFFFRQWRRTFFTERGFAVVLPTKVQEHPIIK
jgi:hypothetical protein